MVAPAMDEDMWNHASLQQNLLKLKSYQNIILNTEHGELASGLIGFGRMLEIEKLITEIDSFFNVKQRLKNKKALVTAGPTYENLDPVRYIGNYSSGKMGIAIAETLANEGCEVILVLGPTSLTAMHANIKTINVRSAQQMLNACIAHFTETDIAVMSAAVADYTPITVSDSKIKKNDEEFTIQLKKTTDILKELGTIKTNSQVLIGFALENNNEKTYALKKLQEKNADAIVLNSLNDEGAGFAHDTNKITIFEKNGNETNYELKNKQEVAKDIVEKIIKLCI
jgi:phosphopantothenoylcysteine decarboxylase/phosphopantothenate--cysteine ligase